MIGRICLLVVLLVLSFVVLTARAEIPATVSGMVRNTEGQAISGASVTLTVRSKEFGFTAATDRDGRYGFRPVPPGEYQFRASHPDYAGCSLKITVREGDTRQIDLVLPDMVGTRERPSEIANTPPPGSSYEREAMLAPGAASAGDGSLTELRANGRTGWQNRVTVDGIDTTQLFEIDGFRPRLAVSAEAIEEVRVASSLYGASTGTGAGVHVALASRRGHDQWHGSVFDDARRSGDGLRADRIGASAGGAIRAGRLFAFGSAEGLRQESGIEQMEIVPAGGLAESAWRVRSHESSYSGRIDSAGGVFARYASRSARSSDRDASVAGAATELAAGWTASRAGFTSTLVAGLSRMPIGSHRYSDTTHRVAEAGSTMFRLPGGDGLASFDYSPRTWSVREDLSWGGGWKAGAELRVLRVPVRQAAHTILSYASIADYNAGRPLSSTFLSRLDGAIAAQELLSAFVQRDWRMRPSLLVSAGMRYELYTVTREVSGRARVFEAARLAYVDGPFYTRENLAFAPRLGMAWSAAGGTVIRAGAGVHYGPGSFRNTMHGIENAASRVQVSAGETLGVPAGVDVRNYRVPERDFQYGVSLEQQMPSRFAAQVAYIGGHGRHLLLESAANLITAVDPLTGAVTRQNPQFAEIPLTTSGGDNLYNSLQALLTRRFGKELALTASYTWGQSHGHSGDAVQDPRCLMCERSADPYDIRHSFTANTTYSRLGWTLTGMWTARSGLPVNVLIDRPDAVLGRDGLWLMSTPGGGANRTSQRPELVPGFDPYARNGRQWLNPAAFAMPAAGSYGNVERNALRGPGLAQVDLAVARTFVVSERVRIEFRAAVYDVAGRINYRNPTNVLPHAGFGYLATPIVQAGALRSGRDGEAGVRFAF